MFTQRQSYCEGRPPQENRQNRSHANPAQLTNMTHLVLEFRVSWSLFWDQWKTVMTLKNTVFTSNNQNYNEWKTNAHLQISVCIQDYSLKKTTANSFSSEKHEKRTEQYNKFKSQLYFIFKIGKFFFNDQCQWVWYSVTVVNWKLLKTTEIKT